MKAFVVHLQSPSSYERLNGVRSFICSDDSGSFGILAGHERLMTVLSPGIASLQMVSGEQLFIGLPESFLYVLNDEIFISTRKYVKETNYFNLARSLQAKLHEEEQLKIEMRQTIKKMEEALIKQLTKAPGEVPL